MGSLALLKQKVAEKRKKPEAKKSAPEAIGMQCKRTPIKLKPVEVNKDMVTICFTGHRPDKLGGYDWNNSFNQKLIKILHDRIYNLIINSEGKDFTFIFGGALGIDQMAFEVTYKIKEELKDYNIILILAMPFENQASVWKSQVDKERLASQKARADKVVIVDAIESYTTANEIDKLIYFMLTYDMISHR
jgi:uncharacterized phage-like protein YoqJ